MQAGYDSSTVELIEAHGTSTVVGDATEMASLSAAFEDIPAGQTVAVGSIKSQIGHLKAAAGIAGLVKAIRAVDTATIPPSAGFSTPNEDIDWAQNPFYVPTEPKPWAAPSGHPRRAGISSFGFGGTNFHCALEAYDRDFHSLLANEFDARRDAWLNPGASAAVTPASSASLSHHELKEIEGGVLLVNAPDLDALKTKLST